MVFDGLLDEGKIHLALNLTRLSELDTTGADTLLYASRELKKAGGNLVVFGLRPSLIEPCKGTRLEASVRFFESEQTAINSFFASDGVKRYDVLELVKSLQRERDHSRAQES